MITKNQLFKNDFFSLKRKRNLLAMLLTFAMVGVSVKGIAQSLTTSLTEEELNHLPHFYFENVQNTTDANDKTKFQLFIESGSDSFSTKVFYIDGATRGFDNGFDSSLFGGVSYTFAIFTELLDDNNGMRFSIQSLPNENYDELVVPIGVIASAGREITFSVISENFPDGINVYLEDKVNKTITNLSEGNHKVLLMDAANGTGQFYIHTADSVLATDFEDIDSANPSLSIYKSSAKEITIYGLQEEKANVKVFSILGQEVFNTNIVGFSNKINLGKLSAEVYIVKLTSAKGAVTKKIILE